MLRRGRVLKTTIPLCINYKGKKKKIKEKKRKKPISCVAYIASIIIHTSNHQILDLSDAP